MLLESLILSSKVLMDCEVKVCALLLMLDPIFLIEFKWFFFRFYCSKQILLFHLRQLFVLHENRDS